jgi:diguanylate cyclase (GGDEF)-like protein
VRQAYIIGSLILIGVYPLLTEPWRRIDFVVVSIGAGPAVFFGLRRIPPIRRRPWQWLLAALLVIDTANVIRLVSNDWAFATSQLLDAVGNALVLVAALALVVRHGTGGLGSIIDATIVALALGGVLWEIVLLPNLVAPYQIPAQKANLFVVVFVLCGVLGALTRLTRIMKDPPPALWLLLTALGLALAGNIILAVVSSSGVRVTAMMMFMGAYVALGLFGLDPSAIRLAGAPDVQPDVKLSAGRLVFLSVAVAAIPVVVGGRDLAGADVDGLLLAVGGTAVAVLVMVRIGGLSLARDRAERALRFEATHDQLTGLPNRREFLHQLSIELTRAPRCVIFFCDLDGFKSVNDRLGHDAGDELLVEVGRRLRSCVRHGDVVSRFGGDEFLILLRDQAQSNISAVRDRIADALSRPVRLRDEEVGLGVSIGIAIATGEAEAEALIRRADRAMYEAKRDEPATPGIRVVSI